MCVELIGELLSSDNPVCETRFAFEKLEQLKKSGFERKKKDFWVTS